MRPPEQRRWAFGGQYRDRVLLPRQTAAVVILCGNNVVSNVHRTK